MQEDGTGYGTKYALQAQEEGHNGGIGVLLSQDLQGVGHTAGENTHIQDGAYAGGDVRPGGVLENEHQNSRDHRAGQELNAAHFNAVHLLGEVVNNQNVQSVAKGT